MAFDSVNERASAIMPMMPFRLLWPVADGTVAGTAEERAMILYLFAMGAPALDATFVQHILMMGIG